jgi:catechol 2,3-dioxygenase-like lactoylglutathione lyase family enzyme
MIQGISHITFIVKDLGKMTKLLTYIFDAQEIYSSGKKIFSTSNEKFFLIDELWIAIMEGESSSEQTYNHIAFKIKESDIDKYLEKIRNLGLLIEQPRSRITGEGQSLYFYDYDNHLFELHTGTLEERLQTYQSKERT